MNYFRLYIYSIVYAAILVTSLLTDWYDILIYFMLASTMLSVLDKLGKGMVLRELIALHTCITCLFMPLLGFNVYNKTNEMAVLWVRYMPIAKDIYFVFALPAVSAFVLALCFPYKKKDANDYDFLLRSIIPRIKYQIGKYELGKTGILIITSGLLMYFLSARMPSFLRFVSLLFYFSAFTGFFYVYFSPKVTYRLPILIGFGAVILLNALNASMFTVVIYMGTTILSFLFIGLKAPLWKKIVFFGCAFFFVIILQNVKPEYRNYTWKKGFEGNKTSLFLNLVSERIKKGQFFTANAFFRVYYRTNQGFNIALVMKRIPAIQPHDQGQVLVRNVASSFVPRILWPDKSEAGGKFNMKFYAGIDIRGWSTNIGPLGEAYGGFGVRGGMIYMLMLGLFIRWAFQRLLNLSKKIPLLMLWLPVLFYQTTYSAETDTLQILNSLVKSSFFIWFIFKIFPHWFGIERNTRSSKRTFPAPVLHT